MILLKSQSSCGDPKVFTGQVNSDKSSEILYEMQACAKAKECAGLQYSIEYHIGVQNTHWTRDKLYLCWIFSNTSYEFSF